MTAGWWWAVAFAYIAALFVFAAMVCAGGSRRAPRSRTVAGGTPGKVDDPATVHARCECTTRTDNGRIAHRSMQCPGYDHDWLMWGDAYVHLSTTDEGDVPPVLERDPSDIVLNACIDRFRRRD